MTYDQLHDEVLCTNCYLPTALWELGVVNLGHMPGVLNQPMMSHGGLSQSVPPGMIPVRPSNQSGELLLHPNAGLSHLHGHVALQATSRMSAEDDADVCCCVHPSLMRLAAALEGLTHGCLCVPGTVAPGPMPVMVPQPIPNARMTTKAEPIP